MKTQKKHKKAHHMRRNMRRNAVAAPAAIPRAVVVRRRPTASELLEAEQAKHQEDSRGWRLVNGVGGALVTGIAGLLLEHQSTLPIPWVTAGLTGLGAALALGAPNKTVRSIGVGAAAAGTTLLGTLADKEWFAREDRKDDHPHVATSSPTAKPPTPGKTRMNASDIPADALARAYERARLKMALASEPTN
jgi:hypothetical protein